MVKLNYFQILALTSYEAHIVRTAVIIDAILLFAFTAVLVALITIQSRSRNKLKEIALVDSVTHGYSRIRFDMEAQKLINNAPSNTYAFVALDIQKFKLINSAYGADAGNKVLLHLHNTISKLIDKGELITRTSSDRFSLLLKNAGRDELVDRLRFFSEKINEFNKSAECKYYLQIVYGVYIINDRSSDMISIHDAANVARKSNKVALSLDICGVAFYSDHEHQKLVREKNITNRMEQALANGEFEVYLQPKIELKTGLIGGAEALVRWNDPARGLLPPSEFIPLFESNGFIVQLDLFVFNESLKLLQRWINAGLNPPPISVNLSRMHLLDPNFLLDYKRIFERYSVPSELIEIEFTESLVFENSVILHKVVDDLHRKGFTCAIDDFGSGYSSLNVLKDVPVDVLKIDREFFNESTMAGERGKCVIASVIDLATSLKMRTVAEGVETIEQVDFLTKTNCDMVQGFIFSKPLPVNLYESYANLSSSMCS